MNTSKTIKAVVGGGRYTVTAPIIKGDYGLYLKLEGLELPATYEVDFSNDEHNGTSVTMIGNADGVLIPNQFISSGKDVFAFLYHVGADFGRTIYKFRIPNKLRPDRTDEEPTPEEQSVIDQTISALNDAVDRAEDAQEAIEDMTVSAETLAEGSTATVTKTEQDGVVHLEFGIPVGATGAQGERGEKGDKGDTGAQGIQGEQGIQGAKGDKGDKGDTGATGAKGEQGERGLTGQDGISPTVTITPITGGHRITITDKDGEHSADVMDGTTPSLTTYVQFTDLATTTKAGVMSAQDKSRLDDVYADYSSALTALGVI